MELSSEEEGWLNGKKGQAISLAMKVLINLGDLEGADRLLPIRSAHVSGVSYLTAGEALLRLLEDLCSKGARAAVPSSLNPAGMDLERWKALGLQEAFAEKQSRIIQLFSNMGISTTCSCIPYETPNAVRPISLGDHLAWGESNAVIYANSLIGARTNRESGISSLASAIAGLTPNYGLHTEEGRMPTLEVRVEGELTHLQYDLLGAYIGNRWNSEVCAFSGLTPPMDNGDLKHLGAALAAKGGHGIFHISGLTPEGWMLDAARSRGAIKEVCSLDAMELEAHKDELYPPPQVEPDAYVLGCPQFGLSEFGRLARAVKGKRLRKDKRIMVFTSRDLRAMVAPDIIRDIEAAGIEVYNDTCMVVTPLRELGICRVGTDSGKAAHYIPKMSKVETELVPLELIVERCT